MLVVDGTDPGTFTISTSLSGLSFKAGSVSLDQGRAPHVQAQLTIAKPIQAILDQIDPRMGQRVTVEKTVDAVTRTFDLGLRRRRMSQRSAEVQLELASDEALLDDYAPLALDASCVAMAGSLRAVVNYVLDKAIPGAALAASPAIDAQMTMLDVDNSVPNPSVETDASGWTVYAAGANTSGRTVGATLEGGAFFRVSYTAAQTAGGYGVWYGGISASASTSYTSSGWVRSSKAQVLRCGIEFKDSGGTILAGPTGPMVSVPANTWVRIACPNVVAPANTASITTTFYGGTGATAWANGDTLDVDGLRVGPTASEPLVWKAGVKALDFLSPLVQKAGYRLVCDESREWTLRDASFTAPGQLVIAYGINLIEGEDDLDRDGDTWFDAQVTRYRWTGADGQSLEAIDAYALTGTPTRVNVVDVDGAYPGPGRSQYAVQRAQGRGREVTASRISDIAAVAEQPVQIVLDGAPVQLGVTQSVTFDLTRDEIEATARTVDTPESAWLLIAAGEEWNDSPVGGSWTGEVI